MKHDDYIVILCEVTFTKVKSVKCNEVISLLESHSDLGK